ncbi:hypothetical protein COX21_02335 [Candidatus Falkowbacteria bacterium CG23_combo_of_CG06-09_8_20_14_all_41_10]|uniref:General secretion pathway GspH domain-containing protein n=3 Tax=Candidatus Falkowiibacteriota TaxID=1752728 RepID=A0A2G9ZMX3_9BACT|nr:MAG: hypothetical protein AUJ35_01890 [Candidatus Falkowbacteria bacterium CG1_02_41_21]PIP34536.1 MAG: hypothetical protein COX21_02335 [Candidatus Falkowbacteria bacterium CG23_combo_of_CG06-09_8_20_14_all_41_10]
MKTGLKKAGFTLIELIVSVSIMAIIVGIFLANYYGSEPQSQLINATSALMRDLRLAQTRGAAGVNYGHDPSPGWGINMASGTSAYWLFADINGDHVYNTSTESSTVKGSREIILPAGVTISGIDLGDPMNITFYQDRDVLKTYLTDGSIVSTSTAGITLTEANTGAVKHVYVNPHGLIYSDL